MLLPRCLQTKSATPKKPKSSVSKATPKRISQAGKKRKKGSASSESEYDNDEDDEDDDFKVRQLKMSSKRGERQGGGNIMVTSLRHFNQFSY